jgi:hypothetical protein
LDTDLAHFEAELKERSARKSGEHAADGHHIETGLSSASLAANNLSLNASTTGKTSFYSWLIYSNLMDFHFRKRIEKQEKESRTTRCYNV